MDIATASLKPTVVMQHQTSIATQNISKQICCTIPSTCKGIASVSPSNIPIQISLPLHRPHRKSPNQPIKENPRKTIISDDPSPSCSTSDVLRLMDSLKVTVTLDLYVSLIKDCIKAGDALQADKLYRHFMGSGLRPTLPLLNLFLFMWLSCGCLESARELFGRMTPRNIYSWAAMIVAYFEKDHYEETINLFAKMLYLGRTEIGTDDARVDVVSRMLVCVLKSCVEVMDLEFGKQVHSWIIKSGRSRNLVLSSSLINFYGRFSCVESSDCVFHATPNRNKVIWTAKISSCCNEERYHQALHVFREMGKEGVKKNSFTFSSVLKASGKIRDKGCCVQQVHVQVIKSGLELDRYVHCSLVDVYGKHGLVDDARRVFDMNVDDRTTSCWNSMIFGYMQHGFYMEAIRILYEMKGSGLQIQESLLNELRLVCGGNVHEKRAS